MTPRFQSLARLQLDFRSGLPVYDQIFEQVRMLASKGRLAPGARLPTVRELARQLQVNFNTVARAYRLLDRAGVVSAQRGRGTFVQALPSPRRTRSNSLSALASRYVESARARDFSDAEIAAEIAHRLSQGRRLAAAGDNHG